MSFIKRTGDHLAAKRLLITGASGLLGFNLAWEAAKNHVVWGAYWTHNIQTDKFQPVYCDLLETGMVEHLVEQIHPDWLIHCAAIADIDRCETNPELAYRVNVEIPGRLARLAHQKGFGFLHISTDAVFDGRKGNYNEQDEPNPLSVYAKVKLAGERQVMENNPDSLIARVNMFGWSPSGKRSLAEHFFYNMNSGKAVKGFTDVYYCPLLVNDLAYILLEMMDKGLTGLYHVFSPECLSKFDFGLRLVRLFGFEENLLISSTVAESELVATRALNLSMNIEKLTQALGYSLPGIDSSLERFYGLHQEGYPQRIRRIYDV